MKKLLFTVLFLIVYGSLYPFQFNFSALSADALSQLVDFNIFGSGVSDAVANVILFIPLGFLAFHLVFKWPRQLLAQALLCFVFAYLIQIGQLYVDARVPYGADAIFNTLGFLAGFALAKVISDYFNVDFARLNDSQIVSSVLLALLFLSLLKPFVPTLDVGLVYENIKQALSFKLVSMSDAFEYLAIYVTILGISLQFKLQSRWLVIGGLASLLLQIFIVDNAGILNQAVALGVVWVLYWFRHTISSPGVYAYVAIAAFLLSNVFPFALTPQLKPIYLVPFQAYLEGNMVTNASAIIYKLTLFVSVFWLASLSHFTLKKLTIAFGMLVLLIEACQMRLVTGTADITDVVMVLFAAWLTKTQLMPIRSHQPSTTVNVSEGPATASFNIKNRSILQTLLLLVVGQWGVMQLPNLPYNVAEIYGRNPNIFNYVFLAAGYLLFCVGSIWIARQILKQQITTLKAPLYAAALSMLCLLCLQLSVTPESIMDINGSSNIVYQLTGDLILGEMGRDIVLWIGPQNVSAVTKIIEPFIRFSALTGPILYLIILSTLLLSTVFSSTEHKWSRFFKYLAYFLPWFFVCKVIAFDYSSTDNLNELIARDGEYGIGGGGYLYLLFALLVFSAVLSAWAIRFRKAGLVVVSLIVFAVSVPINWFLLNQGLEQNVQKYGLEFSGVDFLFGPSRSVLLPQSELFVRWVFVNVVAYFTLVTGLYLGCQQFLQFDGRGHQGTVQSASRQSKTGIPRWLNLSVFAGTASVAVIVIVLYFNKETVKAPNIAWATKDANIILDLHAHSTFSDGSLSPDDLIALADENGCNAFAITDHANYTPSYSTRRQNQIANARDKYPNMLIFNGLELNPPPYGGREHVNVITLPENESVFMSHMRKLHEEGLKNDLAPQTYFNSIMPDALSSEDFFAVYNHPSRKDESEDENVKDLLLWRQETALLSALSGAPGHQKDFPTGSYETLFTTINRWDPAVAFTGSTWDQMLARGYQVWGAIAVSDYHNKGLDYAPCEFARIHLIAPTFTYKGVLDGLRAGTFYADHGRLFSQLKLTVQGSESSTLFAPGNIVRALEQGELTTVSVEVERDEGSMALPVDITLISNCVSGKTEEFTLNPIAPFKNQTMSFLRLESVGLDGNSCYLRAKLSVNVNDETLHAFTNHIRFVL